MTTAPTELDRLVHVLAAPAADPDDTEDTHLVRAALAAISPDELASDLTRVLDALGNRYRVTGGDAASELVAAALARVAPDVLAATVQSALASLPEPARGHRLRAWEDLALHCSALHPALPRVHVAVPPPPQIPEADILAFAPYVTALFAALADNAALPLAAWKLALRERLAAHDDPSGHLVDAVLALARSRFLHDAAENLEDITRRVAADHPPAANVEVDLFDVYTFRRVVDVVRDPATETTRAELGDLDDLELGDDVGLLDDPRSRALRAAALRALTTA